MPVTMKSTDLFPSLGFEGLRLAGKRVWDTPIGSLTSLTLIVRYLEMRSSDTKWAVSRRVVSLSALRATFQATVSVWVYFNKKKDLRAVHVYSAFRQAARHGAVLPPVAPKKATLL